VLSGVLRGRLRGPLLSPVVLVYMVGFWPTTAGPFLQPQSNQSSVALRHVLSTSSPQALGWSVVASPELQGASSWTLDGVSCRNAGACIAVGEADYAERATGLAETWEGGRWSVVPGPVSGPSWSLDGVSCLSQGCSVLGLGADGAYNAFAAWDGTKWSPMPGRPGGSLRSDAGGWLMSLSCVTPSFCVAVGHNQAKSVSTFVAAWSGTKWAAKPSPNRGGQETDNVLNAVSCVSRHFCMAVGDYGPQRHSESRALVPPSKTLVEAWDGSKWSMVPSPNETPAGKQVSVGEVLSAISCLSSKLCVAVGSYEYTDVTLTLVELWDGTRWSVMPSPNPGGQYPSNDELNAVSCVSVNQCVAVGDYQLVGGLKEGLVETWTGAGWTVESSTSLGAPSQGSLRGVSCASSGNCVAVGWQSVGSPSGDFRPLTEHGLIHD